MIESPEADSYLVVSHKVYFSDAQKAGESETPSRSKILGDNLGDDARTHGTATLTDREAETLFHGDRSD